MRWPSPTPLIFLSAAALVCFAGSARLPLAAEETPAKMSMVIPMVRIEVATPNPAVNQTYELEIDSFDGQSLRGFEPQPQPGAVRSLVSINLSSVRSLAFFQRTIEQLPPPPEPPPATDRPPTTAHEPARDLMRRFDHLERDLGDNQFNKILETLKNPEDYRRLRAHLHEQLKTAQTPEDVRLATRNLLLTAFLHQCSRAAQNFETTTTTQYFAQIPFFLRQAQQETVPLLTGIPSEENRTEADNVLNAQEVKLLAKPLAERIWNSTVPPDRTTITGGPGGPRRMGNGNGNGNRPFKGPRPGGRPADPK